MFNFFTSFPLLSKLAWLRNMNTCEKTNHYYYFLFIQRHRTSYIEGTTTPPFLTYFCKRTTFSFILQFSGFSGIFSYFFGEYFKSHRYAATYPRYATYRPLRSGLAAGRYARRYRYFHPWFLTLFYHKSSWDWPRTYNSLHFIVILCACEF